MAAGPLSQVIGHLRRAALLRDGAGMSDGQLLERFLVEREEAAFEALVRRHGPLVMGVCRRVLGNLHDAEDAFQATFRINKDIDDKEFTIDALGIPEKVRRIYFDENGVEVLKDPPPKP